MADSWETPAAAGDSWNSTPAAPTDRDNDSAAPVVDEEAKQKQEEYAKKARDFGWTESTAFDYAEFQRTGGETSDAHLQSLRLMHNR